MLWRVEAVLITQRVEVSTTPRDRMLHTHYWQTAFAPPNHNSLSTRSELGQWVFILFTPPSTVTVNQKHVEATRNCTPCKLQYMYASMYTSYVKPTPSHKKHLKTTTGTMFKHIHVQYTYTMYLQLYIMYNTHCRGWLCSASPSPPPPQGMPAPAPHLGSQQQQVLHSTVHCPYTSAPGTLERGHTRVRLSRLQWNQDSIQCSTPPLAET